MDDAKEADEMLEEEEERVEQAAKADDTEMTVDELERVEGEMGVPIAKVCTLLLASTRTPFVHVRR